MTSNVAVVIPFETGSKLAQANIRLRLAVAELVAMRREGSRLTRSVCEAQAKPAVLPLDDNEGDLLVQVSYRSQRRGSERLGRRHQ
jgi:hypothetical protein